MEDDSPPPPPLLDGNDIAKVMKSSGPVVKCVLLRCRPQLTMNGSSSSSNGNLADDNKEEEDSKPPAKDLTSTADDDKKERSSTPEQNKKKKEEEIMKMTDLIEEIYLDTTPNKSMVQKILGGRPTFLGQYPEEGTVLMIRVVPPSIDEIISQVAEEDEVDSDEEDDDGNDDSNNNNNKKTPPVNAQQVLTDMSISQLRDLCSDRDIDYSNMVEKGDLIEALLKYDKTLPPYNPHPLQPPFNKNRTIRGDILVMRVADTEEELDDDGDDNKTTKGETDTKINGSHEKEGGESDGDETKVASMPKQSAEIKKPMDNEEFFQDYTKEEYIAFASRTDIVERDIPTFGGGGDDDNEEDDDEEDARYAVGMLGGARGGGGDDDDEEEDEEEMNEEDRNAMFNIVMNGVLKQYRVERGRGPNTEELLDMRANIARELGVEVATPDDVEVFSQQQKKRKKDAAATKVDTPSSGKKIAFDSKDHIKEFVPHENEHNYDPPDEEYEDDDDDDDDDDYVEEDDDAAEEPPTKKRKPSSPQKEEEEEDQEDDGDSKPAAI